MSTTTLPAAEVTPARRLFRMNAPGLAGWCLILGLAIRLVHYIFNHTIWYDEAALLINILGKDYFRLLGPLDYEVAAPPLYLWGLRTIAVVFGDHPYVWRFPSFVISCLTLALMAVLARRVLRPGPAAFVVALAAFSDAFVWLGCNVKPYILDALLAASLIYAYLKTQDWVPARRMLLFAAAAPLLLCLSYPMLYLYGGLLAAFLPQLWRQRRAASWAAYLGLAAVLLATLLCLYFGPIRAQRVPGLVAGWRNKMPDLTHPASVPGWVVGNTFLVFHYCYNPVGAALVPLVVMGAWWCVRNRRVDWVCLFLGPVALCLAAAFLQAYPYSNNRLIFYAAPGIGLMAGLGASAVFDRWRGRPRQALLGLAVLLVLPGVGLSIGRLFVGWDQPDAKNSSHFVEERRRPDDLVASDQAVFIYYFGDALSLDKVAVVPARAGQRLWVLMEDFDNADRRRAVLLSRLPPHEWELQSEARFWKANVFLLIQRGSDMTSNAAAADDAVSGN